MAMVCVCVCIPVAALYAAVVVNEIWRKTGSYVGETDFNTGHCRHVARLGFFFFFFFLKIKMITSISNTLKAAPRAHKKKLPV